MRGEGEAGKRAAGCDCGREGEGGRERGVKETGEKRKKKVKERKGGKKKRGRMEETGGEKGRNEGEKEKPEGDVGSPPESKRRWKRELECS
ncbi:hypothetical protein, partial [Salmonella enterica]|uniref:hypothetical protein n=1 Tax=Salmonella enterica TaxID=28901 RepID=UPI00398C2F44